jgi:ribosomal protein S18 acetylase RimI-like enzyme
MSDIALAQSEVEIAACFDVMVQLRPHLRREEFIARIQAQQAQGYQLASRRMGSKVVAVAGFRLSENLAWGRFLYIDDLVTDAAHRSQGHGDAMMNWLMAHARAAGCAELHLDSGVQRFGAHRFYLARRMDITSHHFAMKLA